MNGRFALHRMALPPPVAPGGYGSAGRRASGLPDVRLQDARAEDEPRVALGWGALGALSVSLLLLALVVPDTLGVALAAIGLAGLLVFRLAAMHDGWAPLGPVRASLGPREAFEGDTCAGDGASRRTVRRGRRPDPTAGGGRAARRGA